MSEWDYFVHDDDDGDDGNDDADYADHLNPVPSLYITFYDTRPLITKKVSIDQSLCGENPVCRIMFMSSVDKMTRK